MLWKPLRLVPAKTTFDFLGKRRLALALSTLINVLSLLGVIFVGLNFGIDFKGGIAIQARSKQGPAHLDNLRDVVGNLGVGEVSLQEFGDANTVLIRVQRQEGSPQCVAAAERVMQKRAPVGKSSRPRTPPSATWNSRRPALSIRRAGAMR